MIDKRPWGWSRTWTDSQGYTGKIIKIKKGHRLSLQYHREKRESILVLKGRLQITLLQRGVSAISVLRPGDSHDISPMTVHRFEAPFGEVELIEVSIGKETDLVRLQDDYGRS